MPSLRSNPLPQRLVQLIVAIAAGVLMAAVATAVASNKHHAHKHHATASNVPGRGKVFFGVTDTGEEAGFNSFAKAVGKHPAVIETYHAWGTSVHISLPRWEKLRARPMLAISTEEGGRHRHEVITPKQIARGKGDEFLLRMNHSFAAHAMPAYIRPLGEPNRCLNAYTAIRCDGSSNGADHKFFWYKQAFRRMYLVLHGGAKRARINKKLHKLHLPSIRKQGHKLPRLLPRAPVSVIWSPVPSGAGAYFPGYRYVDWVGTDIYSRYTDFGALSRFYHHYAKRKPFAITEFGLWGSDDPSFVRHLLSWARAHKHTRMLVYYQDFGLHNPFRIQNFSQSRAVLKHALNSHHYPARAPRFPRPGRHHSR